jgi:diguanylate cyclase (GGDEF)-like protein
LTTDGAARSELRFRAGLSRVVVAAAGLVLLPTLYPDTRRHLLVWAAYLTVALGEQELIRRGLGGRARTVASGLVDTLVLTYTVHLLGSVGTPLLSVYLFASVANALVGDLAVTLGLAAASCAAYDAIVWAEYTRLVPFAPDVPRLAALGPPPVEQAIAAILFVTMLMLLSTAIVGKLVETLDYRQEQLRAANERLEELTQHDPLTELYNRRYLFDRVSAELARVRRGFSLAVIMLDLDGFKAANDTLGHQRGDALLREVAAALVSTTRVTDVVGRYGGDEFLIVLSDTDAASALVVAERIVEAVRDVGARYPTPRPVTASLGIASATTADSVPSLLNRADENAYSAKQGGGDRLVA